MLTPRRLVVVAFLLIGWAILAWGAARLLMVDAPLEHADAIVVLSGSAAYQERAEKAAELYRTGIAPRIILTNDNREGGWSVVQQRNPFFYERTRDELLRMGVPANSVEVLFQPVSSTRDEALLLNGYANNHLLRSIVVVTSPYHSRRALMTFRLLMPGKNIGLVHPQPGIQSPVSSLWWLYPSGWRTVPSEYLKLVYYRLFI
jgi:uncharacterized SAM-binding protein YcdF (DUF218 family)